MTDFPTPLECMREAYRELKNSEVGNAQRAQGLIMFARELNDEQQRAWSRRSAEQKPEPAVRAAPTLHDVEGIVCAHGEVALRWKDRGGQDGDAWWLHVDGTSCDNADQSAEALRRYSDADRPLLDAGQRMQDDPSEPATGQTAVIAKSDGNGYDTERLTDTTLIRPMPPIGEIKAEQLLTMPKTFTVTVHEGKAGRCRNCSTPIIYMDGRWRHTKTAQSVCLGQRDEQGNETYNRFAVPQ
jgi:hypothetical protein